jgi:hypothetical protein
MCSHLHAPCRLTDSKYNFLLLDRLYSVTDRLAGHFAGGAPPSRRAFWPAVALFLASSPRLLLELTVAVAEAAAAADGSASVATAGKAARAAARTDMDAAGTFADGVPKGPQAEIPRALRDGLSKSGLDADADELGRGVRTWSDVLDVGFDVSPSKAWPRLWGIMLTLSIVACRSLLHT